MSASASKGNKRTDAFWELEKAVKSIRKALDDLATIGEVLEALGSALKHTRQAGTAAQATTLEWEEKGGKRSKTKRDALPAPLRRSIAAEITRLEALRDRIKALPVTKDEKAIAKRIRKGNART